MNYKYQLVAVGGTFDRFHKGHESLIRTAFNSGKRVVIGLTTAEMIQGKTLATIVDSYETRKKAVMSFLDKNNYTNRSELVPLVDPYGPLKRRRDIEAVIVGPRFSKEAVEKLKKHIDIVHCPIVHTDRRTYLSSTSIRLGQVNRTGRVYRLPRTTLILPSKAREYLKKPLGKILKQLPNKLKKPGFLLTIGDETTRLFTSRGLFPDMAVVDFQVQRQQTYSSTKQLGLNDYKVTKVKNPAGTLTPRLVQATVRATKHILSGQKQTILVQGEEDLATLLCILFAPLTSIVCYGQPNEGLVWVEVTEEKKEEISKLLSTFTPQPSSATIK